MNQHTLKIQPTHSQVYPEQQKAQWATGKCFTDWTHKTPETALSCLTKARPLLELRRYKSDNQTLEYRKLSLVIISFTNIYPQLGNKSMKITRGFYNDYVLFSTLDMTDHLLTGGTAPLPPGGAPPRPAAWACQEENKV